MGFPVGLKCAAARKMMLCGAEKTGGKGNYEKHALRASQVIAAVAKVSCKHGLWLVARVKNCRNLVSGSF
ncbi:hypothetical protein DW826_03300 [Clostridium sp. AM34-11AC]|nr:hypothetical protein DW826_03300 [Clostridium sp. AM34-11AC]